MTCLQVLHAGNNNKKAFKVLIAAEYNNIKVELIKNFEMANKTPEFLKMNHIRKVSYAKTCIFSLESNEVGNVLEV